MRRLLWVCLLGGLVLTGCPKKDTNPQANPTDKPIVTEEQKSIIEQLQDLPPVEKCTDKELEAQAQDMSAIGGLASYRAMQIDREQKNRWVKGWEKWSWISGFIGIGAGIAAAFVIWKLGGSLKTALGVGTGLIGLGILAFAFAQVMAHWHVLMIMGLIVLGVGAAIAIYLLVEGKLRDAYDALRIVAKKVNVNELKDELANAQGHSVDSIQALIDKVSK